MSTDARRELPSPTFLKPPVVEVVCGLQFPPIPQWLTTHYGLFWHRVKKQYSRSEDQPPLPKVKITEFQEPQEIEIGALPPLRRVFLIDESNSYLIQIQQNRFLHNWRKVDGDYPRFAAAYQRFTDQWKEFKLFLDSAELVLPRLEAYELTYVNVISAPEAVFPRDIWRFLNFYNAFPSTATGANPRALNFSIRWPLDHEMGALSLTIRHGRRPGSESDDHFLMAEFSARGAAGRDGVDMDSWFQSAHDAIVHTFVALTTEQAHNVWEKIK